MDNLVLLKEKTENFFYKEFTEACIELKEVIKTKEQKNSLEDLITELQND